MNVMHEAVRNDLFWSLHLWVDSHYIACAKTAPAENGPLHPERMQLMPRGNCMLHLTH